MSAGTDLPFLPSDFADAAAGAADVMGGNIVNVNALPPMPGAAAGWCISFINQPTKHLSHTLAWHACHAAAFYRADRHPRERCWYALHTAFPGAGHGGRAIMTRYKRNFHSRNSWCLHLCLRVTAYARRRVALSAVMRSCAARPSYGPDQEAASSFLKTCYADVLRCVPLGAQGAGLQTLRTRRPTWARWRARPRS